MRTFFALWRRELAAMFLSPIAYVMLMFFLLVTGCGFYWLVKENLEVMRSVQGLMVVIWACMLIVVPVLTMRTFAEERKNGTFETMMTAPVHDSTVVSAKFAGVLTFFMVMCAPTLLYLVITRMLAPEAAHLIEGGPDRRRLPDGLPDRLGVYRTGHAGFGADLQSDHRGDFDVLHHEYFLFRRTL